MREIVFDTETTGRNPNNGDRIVEVAAVELVDGQLGRRFRTLVNPGRSIPAEVTAVHGITDADVANAPTFKEVLPQILEFFGGAKAYAHNSEFDERFMDAELKIAGHEGTFWSVVDDTVDTLQLSRRIWTGKDEAGQLYKHNLDVVLDRCGIDRSRRVKHGALVDSELLAEVIPHMLKLLKAKGPSLEDDVERGPIKRIGVEWATKLPALPDAAPAPVASAPRGPRP